ncbi:MAG: phage holin family protein [Alphaproteobacteria bacterium]|nr:phage holin family protein [Alphaproteobacteria bacterium]MBU1513143.1 phage holin family protein [Alphaproteobacteria bacterium]MBU2095251.1 phage holin family protein [Alphaproteobacteria bacterium]MBU2152166.1 phage holin family protein [Alphaproteobacteria bacterium]MBU2306787.1 phage holin family protein [Alphaproteobacteria bacterium]
MEGASPPRDARGLTDLIAQLGGDLAALVRKESELVRAEVSEKLNSAGKAIGDIAAGGLLLVAALLVLLQALVLALSKLMDPIWAALIVGLGVAALGALLVRTGMKAITLGSLTPGRTTRQLKKDAELMKGSSK